MEGDYGAGPLGFFQHLRPVAPTTFQETESLVLSDAGHAREEPDLEIEQLRVF